MYTTIKIRNRRNAFTLVEMMVVIAIIIALAALAAAFAPRVDDSQKMTRAVDNLEQWLLTAKMRAKRDGLATGIRFVQAPGDAPLTFSQVQYIQQPEPLAGYPGGPTLVSAGNGTVTFSGVDFSLGGVPYPNQWLVQPGDYLSINGGGVFLIGQVSPTSPTNTLVLGAPNLGVPPSLANAYVLPPISTPYGSSLTLTATTNFRILRQPRILIGEEPLALPNNYAVDMRIIPGPVALSPPGILPNSIIPNNTTILWSNVALGSSGFPEILFSPTGAVVGSNAGSGMIFITVYDMTMNPFDINRVGIVGVQTRTGFIGAYDAAAGAGSLGYDPFYLARLGRDSGL